MERVLDKVENGYVKQVAYTARSKKRDNLRIKLFMLSCRPMKHKKQAKE